MKKFNYLLILVVFAFKGFDVLVTSLVLDNGGLELNPLGFNSFTILMGFVVILPLFFINIISKDKIILLIVGIGCVSMMGMLGKVIIQGVELL